MAEQVDPQPGPEELSTPLENLHQNYQDALLKSGVQAANLLTELIELKLMPDPRAKEMAEVALEVLKLANEASVNRGGE